MLHTLMKQLNKKQGAFYFLLALAGMILFGVGLLIWKGIEMIINHYKQKKDDELEQMVQQRERAKAMEELEALVSKTNFMLYKQVVKTSYTKDSDIKLYINLLAFDSTSCSLVNVNQLVNKVCGNTLNINTRRGDNEGTIIISDTTIDSIQAQLRDMLNIPITISNIK